MNGGAAILSGVIFFFGSLFLGLVVGAAILRASIFLLNKILGDTPVQSHVVSEGFSDFARDANDPFAAPTNQAVIATSGGAVPMPSIWKAIGIVIVAGLCNFAAAFLIRLVSSPFMPQGLRRGAPVPPNAMIPLVGLYAALFVSYFVTFAFVLKQMLRTTWARSFLVIVCQFIVSILATLAIGLVVGGILLAIGFFG